MNISKTSGLAANQLPQIKTSAPAPKQEQQEPPADPVDGWDANGAIDFTDTWSKRAGLTLGVGVTAVVGLALTGQMESMPSALNAVLTTSMLGAAGLGIASTAISLAGDEQGQISSVGDGFSNAWSKISAPGAGTAAVESMFSADSNLEAAQKIGVATATGIIIGGLAGNSMLGQATTLTTALLGASATVAALGSHLFEGAGKQS